MTKSTQSRWTILVSRNAERVLDRLPSNLVQRIDRKILALAGDPRPRGCKKLEGHANIYRVRVGGWRVSYALEDAELIILVIEVAPRGRAYRF
jgi:mRNA interferase RelE/StbE